MGEGSTWQGTRQSPAFNAFAFTEAQRNAFGARNGVSRWDEHIQKVPLNTNVQIDAGNKVMLLIAF